MKLVYAWIILLGFALLFSVVVAIKAQNKVDAMTPGFQRLNTHCKTVRQAVRFDAVMLEDQTKPNRPQEGMQRFMREGMRSKGEIELCLGDLPSDLKNDYDACYIDGDLTCLGKLARQTERELAKRFP